MVDIQSTTPETGEMTLYQKLKAKISSRIPGGFDELSIVNAAALGTVITTGLLKIFKPRIVQDNPVAKKANEVIHLGSEGFLLGQLI